MNKTSENKLSMFYAVLAACEKYTGVWTPLPSFQAAHDELVTNVRSLEEATRTQETSMRGAALDKRFKRDTMTQRAVKVAQAMFVLGEATNDILLREKANYAASDFVRKRDAVVAQLCQSIHDLAGGLGAALVPYGVTAVELTELQAAVDAYVGVVSAPRNATTVLKGATAEIAALMKDSMKVLNNRMDNLMPQFQQTSPSFFQEYFDARIIVDLKGSSGKSEEKAAAA